MNTFKNLCNDRANKVPGKPRKYMKLKHVIGIFLLLIATDTLFGQHEFPPLSAKGEITQLVGNTIVQIEYERPSARNRKIFGKLVPWNNVWRTGAGHCTTISFDRPVIVGGQTVKAGKYALFTIPNPGKWMVILNSDTTLYGTSNYDPAQDVARFPAVPSTTQRFYETFTIDIDLIPNNARIYLSWAHTAVSFELETNTDAETLSFIDDLLAARKETDSNTYAGAAEYLYYQNNDLSKAISLTDIAIELDEKNGWARRLNMELHEKLGQYDKAVESVNLALQATTDQDEIEWWKSHKKRLLGIISRMRSKGQK